MSAVRWRLPKPFRARIHDRGLAQRYVACSSPFLFHTDCAQKDRACGVLNMELQQIQKMHVCRKRFDGKAWRLLQRDFNLEQSRRTLPILHVLTGPVQGFFHRLPRYYNWGEHDVCNPGLRYVLDKSIYRETLGDRVLEASMIISDRTTLS